MKTSLKLISDFYCPKCKNLFEIRPFYGLNNADSVSFWKDGYWLEWYIKKLCMKTYSRSIIGQGILLNDDGNQIEIDVIVIKNKKSYGIECKSSSPFKTMDFGEVANILKYKNYVDKSILVTTGKLKPQDRKFLDENEISIVTGLNIKEIASYLV